MFQSLKSIRHCCLEKGTFIELDCKNYAMLWFLQFHAAVYLFRGEGRARCVTVCSYVYRQLLYKAVHLEMHLIFETDAAFS